MSQVFYILAVIFCTSEGCAQVHLKDGMSKSECLAELRALRANPPVTLKVRDSGCLSYTVSNGKTI